MPANSGLPKNQTGNVNPYEQFGTISGADVQLANLESASFEERAAAFTLDLLLMGVVKEGLSLVGAPAFLAGTISLLYFVIGALKYGRTLGKHIVGLRVIHEGPLEPLRPGQVLLRETVGRFVSAALLGLGYWIVIFRDDRRAIHDSLAKTRVVSFRPQTLSKSAQVLRGLISIAAVLALIVTVSLVAILLTNYPLQTLHSKLYMAGVRAQGLHGNYFSGYRIDRLIWDAHGDRIELQGIELEVENLTALLLKPGMKVRRLAVAQGHLKFLSSKDEKPRDSATAAPSVEKAAVFALFPPGDMVISEIDIRDLIYESNDDRFQLKRLYAEELMRTEGRLTLGRLYVDSSDFIFNVPHLTYGKDGLTMEKFVEALVRPTMFPEVLRADSDFRVKATGSLADPNLEMQGFQGKLKVERGLMGLNAEFKDWSPGHYLRGHWPVRHMFLKISGKGPLKTALLGANVEGGFSFYRAPFRILEGQTAVSAMLQGLTLVHERGAYQAQMKLYPARAEGAPWIVLTSNFQLPSQAEELAYLVYGKAWGTLTESERDGIVRDLGFFRNPPFAPELFEKIDMRAPASAE